MIENRIWIIGIVFFLMGGVSAISVCIDNEAPSVPGDLSVSGEVGDILISWSGAVDSPDCSGVDYYVVFRDGVEIGQIGRDVLSFVDDASLEAGSYTYGVFAVDMVGKNAGASIVNDIVVDNDGNTKKGSSPSSYVCGANWSCGEWSECVSGEMKRICEDVSNCGTEYLKPVERLECGSGSGDDEDLEQGMSMAISSEEGDDFGMKLLSAVTGAVTGGGSGGIVAAWILLGLSVLGLVIARRRRK